MNDVNAYPQIFDATNAAALTDRSFVTLTDPNRIEVGQKVCIPASGDPTNANEPIVLRTDASPLNTVVEGAAQLGERVRYTVNMQANEFLDVSVSALENNAAITIIVPGGTFLSGAEDGADATRWSGTVPAAGAYTISIGSTRGNATYSLVVRAAPATLKPLTQAMCDTWKTEAERLLGVSATTGQAPIFDTVKGAGGVGCVLTAEGTGVNFASPTAVDEMLKPLFADRQQDQNYSADGPTGTWTAFVRDRMRAIVSAQWQPGPAVTCPADQPISACNVPPDQRIYKVTIEGFVE